MVFYAGDILTGTGAPSGGGSEPPPGEGDIFFESDFAGASPWNFDAPGLGFDGLFFDHAIVAGGADGLPYWAANYREGVDWGGNRQHSIGPQVTFTPSPARAKGDWFFVRERLRIENQSAGGIGYTGKHVQMILAAADGAHSRVILDFDGVSPSVGQILTRNIDSTSLGQSGVSWPDPSQWRHITSGVKPSSASAIIDSITRVGTTGTCTTQTSHGFTTGDRVELRGAFFFDVAAGSASSHLYEGVYTITVTGTSTFTFTTVNSSLVSPAIFDVSTPTNNPAAMRADAQLRLWIDGDHANGFANPTDVTTAEFGIHERISNGMQFQYGSFNAPSSGNAPGTPAPNLHLGTFQVGNGFNENWHDV